MEPCHNPSTHVSLSITNFILKLFDLAALALGRPAAAFGPVWHRFLRALQGPEVLFGRSQILQVIWNETGPNAFFQQANYFHGAIHLPDPHGNDFAGTHLTRRFDRVAANVNFAALARLTCEGAGFVEPHRPEPLVYPY